MSRQIVKLLLVLICTSCLQACGIIRDLTEARQGATNTVYTKRPPIEQKNDSDVNICKYVAYKDFIQFYLDSKCIGAHQISDMEWDEPYGYASDLVGDCERSGCSYFDKIKYFHARYNQVERAPGDHRLRLLIDLDVLLRDYIPVKISDRYTDRLENTFKHMRAVKCR